MKLRHAATVAAALAIAAPAMAASDVHLSSQIVDNTCSPSGCWLAQRIVGRNIVDVAQSNHAGASRDTPAEIVKTVATDPSVGTLGSFADTFYFQSRRYVKTAAGNTAKTVTVTEPWTYRATRSHGVYRYTARDGHQIVTFTVSRVCKQSLGCAG